MLLLGLLGLLCYYYLRPGIDINASGPIQKSKAWTENYITELAPQLGFSADSMALVSFRNQHLSYIKTLRDTSEIKLKPADLNEADLHTQSWETVVSVPNKSSGFLSNLHQLFESSGRLKINMSNQGQVMRIQENPDFPNPTFLQGDSLIAIADNLVQNILGYDLNFYDLVIENSPDTTFNLSDGQNKPARFSTTNTPNTLNVNWVLKDINSKLPQKISLKLAPTVREINNEQSFRTEFGFNIISFAAYNAYEPLELSSYAENEEEDDLAGTYIFFIIVILLPILVFSLGFRNIFKGKVEWRRALFIFVTLSLGVYGWRTLFFINTYNEVLSNAGFFGSTINNLLFALILGLYGCLAYISWEALARNQRQGQVDVIDALWQGKIFLSETGAALVHGVAIGAMAIGVISAAMYFMNEFIIQADSQFGYAEPSIKPRLLTLNMSSWTTTWLVSIGQIGFVYSIIKHWFKQNWIIGVLSILFTGISISVLGRLLGTSGTIYQDMVLFLAVSVIFVYAIKEYGLLTVSTGWWFFTVFFMIQPYMGSSSLDIAYVAWVQIGLMTVPLIYGFIAYKYGGSTEEVGEYIPEYEERIAQHLRVEKEIEIARESQYKLMPLQPPKAENIDVYGFFLPSFEVGGDYFDYVLSKNSDGKAEALTMVVVDVSGKAMRAAMPAVFTSGLLLSRMKEDTPDEVLSKISEPIYARTDKRTFITCVLARYDLMNMSMSIANAGHCRPVLKRNGLAEFIHTPQPSFPLGLKEEVTYKAEQINLKKGDFFLLYSDGLPEAVNENGERFGFDEVPRLIESIDTDSLSAQDIALEIKKTIQKFSNYQLADDTTIICLKV